MYLSGTSESVNIYFIRQHWCVSSHLIATILNGIYLQIHVSRSSVLFDAGMFRSVKTFQRAKHSLAKCSWPLYTKMEGSPNVKFLVHIPSSSFASCKVVIRKGNAFYVTLWQSKSWIGCSSCPTHSCGIKNIGRYLAVEKYEHGIPLLVWKDR